MLVGLTVEKNDGMLNFDSVDIFASWLTELLQPELLYRHQKHFQSIR